MPGPVVEADLVVFDHEGRVLLVRDSPNDSWTTPGGALQDHEYVHAAAARIARGALGISFYPQRVLGCYQEASMDIADNAPGKIKFAVSTTLEPDAARRVNLRSPEGSGAELHWWEPPSLLAASDVAPPVKNYFSPTPWNKVL